MHGVGRPVDSGAGLGVGEDVGIAVEGVAVEGVAVEGVAVLQP